jgi:hypothetical protein
MDSYETDALRLFARERSRQRIYDGDMERLARGIRASRHPLMHTHSHHPHRPHLHLVHFSH